MLQETFESVRSFIVFIIKGTTCHHGLTAKYNRAPLLDTISAIPGEAVVKSFRNNHGTRPLLYRRQRPPGCGGGARHLIIFFTLFRFPIFRKSLSRVTGRVLI